MRSAFATLALLSLWSFPATAPATDATLDTATIQRILAAAVTRASAIKVPMGVAVVDSGGDLVGFIKMQGAFVHTNHTAFAKAYTAASVRRPTGATGIPPQIVNELAWATGGRFTGLPGGLPLEVRGQVIGAVGAAGGDAAQDVDVAKAAVSALTSSR